MKNSSLLIIFILLSQTPVFAAPTKIDCDIKLYSCYEKHVEDICNAKDLPWWMGSDLWALNSLSQCKYPEMTSEEINSTISCMETLEQNDPISLKDGVSLSSIGTSSTFRIAETARLLYRRNMNSIFSCAIVASRSAKLDSLNSILSGIQWSSEIQKSVEKERKRYETLKNQMSCDLNRPERSSTGAVERVINSSMKEYCKYSYYLDYLEANSRENFSSLSTTETQIGAGNTSKPANTTDDAQREIISRGQIIKEERIRANDVLPKAIVAFQEMDRTYIVHVMLTFIYDDYLRLRNQLNTYLTAIGQTFEKAFNAQDSSQR